jgi:hypothetical protein
MKPYRQTSDQSEVWVMESILLLKACCGLSRINEKVIVLTRRKYSSVGIGTKLRAGWSVFDSSQRLGIFLFTTVSIPPLGSTQLPPSLRVKRPGHEADQSLLSSSEVKNAWNYTSTPSIRHHGVVPGIDLHLTFTLLCTYGNKPTHRTNL